MKLINKRRTSSIRVQSKVCGLIIDSGSCVNVCSVTDTIQERSNSDFDVKCATIQFYGNSNNSQSDRWIGLKVYMESSDMLSYVGLEFQGNRSLGRHRNMGHQSLYEFCYLLHFDLLTTYLARIIFLKGCGSLFWESPISTKIFNVLQHSFQVWQWFINVLESFSYKDSLFIIATKKGKKISELILPSDLILLAYMGLLKGNNSDPIIFRIVNSDLLLLLLFSS
jgi:hypothetical protein